MVQVKDLNTGMKVALESGKVVTITSICRGWWSNSKFINYSNGEWSCLFDNDKIEVL